MPQEQQQNVNDDARVSFLKFTYYLSSYRTQQSESNVITKKWHVPGKVKKR